MTRWLIGLMLGAMLLAGCESMREKPDLSTGHIQAPAEQAPATEDIPPPVAITPQVPLPQVQESETTHTVVVYDVPVTELLFSLARDSDLNLDVDPAIDATVTINAVEQPLPAILDRIADSADLRYELRDNSLRVSRDTPYLRNYRLDSLNMARRSTGNVAVATQIQSTGTGNVGEQGGAGGNVGNSSDTLVQIDSDYDLWGTLYQNVHDILSDGVIDEALSGSDTANPNIVINREAGVMGVRATGRQHRVIQKFVDSVEHSIGKQVLIEATIAEVRLSDSFQAGIDWALLQEEGTSGINVNQGLVGENLQTPPSFVFNVTDFNGGDVLSATLRALETFGDVSVMSSPKVMAMNNQTAVLKVVDNLVYFTTEVNIDNGTSVNEGRLTTFETEIYTVPVGFVMSVTPFVDDENEVILNVRPTISRVIDFVQDPNPALAEADVVSEIPVIQVREVESVLKVASGNIAVIGGLMQDEVQRNTNQVPLLGSLPLIGPAFQFADDKTEKTELVIFIQPRVTANASLDGDLQDFRRYLPETPARYAMSVLLEALKKAALEKRNRDESAGGGNAPAVDGEQFNDSQDELDHLPADDAAEPLEQKPVVNAAATDYLARQEARRASPVIESPEDPPAAEPRAPAVEPAVPATSDEEPSASHREPSAPDEEPSALHGEPSAPDEEPSALHGEPSATDEEPSALHEEPSAPYEEPPAPVSEPVEVSVSDTSTAERNDPLGDDFALPDEASEEAPPFAAAPEADDEDDLDLDLHMSASDEFESPVAAAAPEPEPEASASGVDAAEQRRALQQLMSRSRDVLKQRKRRGTYMYAALIFTSLGAIGLYYYALSSDGGLLMPEPAIESAEVFSEPGSLAAEEPASTPLADEPEAAGSPAEAMAEAAPVESTLVPDTPAPEVTETLANREPVALVEPVRTAMKPSTEPAFQTESRVLIERRQTPRPLARKVNDAYRAYQAGDIDRASTLYREVLEESPRQRDALLGVAAIAVQRGQYQEALRYYQRRLVDDSGDHFARAGLLALAGQGVTDPELQSEVKLLLDDYPQQAHLHFLLGSLQAAAGSWAEAQRSFFEARSWDRENPDYAYNLAVSLEHLRQPRQALSQYRQALELARVTPPQFDLEVASRRVSYLENRP